MSVLSSTISAADKDFQLNYEAFEKRVADLHERRQIAHMGGSEKARKLHIDRGMLLPRHRVEAVLDPGTPFLELGELAGGPTLYDGVPVGASLITGGGACIGATMYDHCQ